MSMSEWSGVINLIYLCRIVGLRLSTLYFRPHKQYVYCHFCFLLFSPVLLINNNNPSRSASRNRLHNTTPARLESKGKVQPPGRAGSVPRGGRSNPTATANKDNNNNKKEATAGNVRNKAASSASPPRRPASAAGEFCFVRWKYLRYELFVLVVVEIFWFPIPYFLMSFA